MSSQSLKKLARLLVAVSRNLITIAACEALRRIHNRIKPKIKAFKDQLKKSAAEHLKWLEKEPIAIRILALSLASTIGWLFSLGNIKTTGICMFFFWSLDAYGNVLKELAKPEHEGAPAPLPKMDPARRLEMSVWLASPILASGYVASLLGCIDMGTVSLASILAMGAFWTLQGWLQALHAHVRAQFARFFWSHIAPWMAYLVVGLVVRFAIVPCLI